MKKALFSLRIVFSALLFAFLFTNVCFSENVQEVSLAIISSQGSRAIDEGVKAELEVRLSHFSGIKLVEREQIKTVLKELQFVDSGMMDTGSVPKLGQLLSADILMFIEKIPNQSPETYRVRLVESQTGVILTAMLETQQTLRKESDSVIAIVSAAIDKHHVPMTDRYFIGVLGFKSEEPGSSLDGTAEVLRMLLDVDLASISHVVILDRENFQHLQTEKFLTGLDLNLKKSAVLVDGGIKYAPGRKNLNITVYLRFMSDSREKEINLTVPIDNISLARKIIVKDILAKLNLTDSVDSITDPDREAELFLSRVPFFLSGGDFESAVRHAEAAYVLKPNQKTRYWAARAWYALGWTLAKSIRRSDTFAAGVMRVQTTKPTQTTNVPKFWGDFKNTQNTNSHRLKGQRPMGTRTRALQNTPKFVLKPSQLHSTMKRRSLSAFIRAYTLIYELSRFHVRDYDNETNSEKKLEIPDPTKFPKRPSIRGYTVAEVPLLFNDEDTAANRELYRQLTDMRNDIIRFQQKFYARYSGSAKKGQALYWDTWNKKKNMVSHVKNNTSKKITLIRQAIDAFVEMDQSDLETKVKGLVNILDFYNQNLTNEEISLYKDLTQHKNSFVRMIAYRRLIQIAGFGAAKKQLEIFIQEFPYEHSFWKFKNRELIPRLLTPAVYQLAISEGKTVLVFAQRIIEPLLKHNDAVNLVSWRDIFWPYVNVLGLAGFKADQSRVVQKAIQVLDLYEKKDGLNYLEQLSVWWESSVGKKNTLVEDKEFFRKIQNMRAELELQLVQMGLKKKMDLRWNKILAETPIPSYMRQMPEIEPPHLEGPLNAKIIQSIKNSKQEDLFSGGTTWSVGKEGNVQIIMYNSKTKDAQLDRKKNPYEIREMASGFPVGKNDYEIFRDKGYSEWPRNPENILIDGNYVYVVSEARNNNKLNMRLYKHDFTQAGVKYLMGEASIDVKMPGAFYVTSMAIGGDGVYVGTLGGVVKYLKDGGQISTRISPPVGYYLPYATGKQSKKLQDTKIVHFTEDNGFPDNNVLSLAYYKGKLYAGTGSVERNKFGLTGKSGFSVFDPKQGDYEVIASSSALKKLNGLDGGDPYQIQSLLVDEKRLCLWLAVAENKKRNGIWRYDFKTGKLKHVVKENFSVQKLAYAGNDILYLMHKTGVVQYKPESRTKTWLLGYQPSFWSNNSPPVSPKGYKGDALYGHPQTRLWPTVIDKGRLLTLNWSGYLISLDQKNSEPLILTNTSNNHSLGEIECMARNGEGTVIVNVSGQVFLVTLK